MIQTNQTEELIKDELGEEYFRTWKIKALLEVYKYAFDHEHDDQRELHLKKKLQKELEQLANTYKDWQQIYEAIAHLQSRLFTATSPLPQKALEKMLELAETIYDYCYLYVKAPDNRSDFPQLPGVKTPKEYKIKKACREKILAMPYEGIIRAFFWFNKGHRYEPLHEELFEKMLSLQKTFDQPWQIIKDNMSYVDEYRTLTKKLLLKALSLAETVKQTLEICRRASNTEIESAALNKALELAKTFDECLAIHRTKDYMRPALEKALQIANTVRQCLIIADCRHFNSDLDEKALEKAFGLAKNLKDLMAISKKVDESSSLHKKILRKIKGVKNGD